MGYFLKREVDPATDLFVLHAQFPQRYPGFLASIAQGSRSRWDILFAVDGGGFQLDFSRQVQTLEGDPQTGGFLDTLDREWRAVRVERPQMPEALPFRGGWLLMLGYELAREIEPRLILPGAPPGPPIAIAFRCPAALVRDRRENRVWAVAEAEHAKLIDLLVEDARLSLSGISLPELPVFAIDEEPAERFLAGVAKVHDYLRAGDVFQVNLSRNWMAQPSGKLDPAALFAKLCATNPAPFAGSLIGDGWAVASSSPERLLWTQGVRIETRPIAGTRPRRTEADDGAAIRQLVGNPKERAEHIMLIDLERNDLGRVCAIGSVTVEELMAVESYAHVHHIESTVAGRLRPEVTPGDIIRALFPFGTITGCPKVRCMEIIAELEGAGRGPYTGALGYLNGDGDMQLSVLIRSLIWNGSEVRFRAGAGIVADSQAERELAETRAKARGLLRALGAV